MRVHGLFVSCGFHSLTRDACCPTYHSRSTITAGQHGRDTARAPHHSAIGPVRPGIAVHTAPSCRRALACDDTRPGQHACVRCECHAHGTTPERLRNAEPRVAVAHPAPQRAIGAGSVCAHSTRRRGIGGNEEVQCVRCVCPVGSVWPVQLVSADGRRQRWRGVVCGSLGHCTWCAREREVFYSYDFIVTPPRIYLTHPLGNAKWRSGQRTVGVGWGWRVIAHTVQRGPAAEQPRAASQQQCTT